jgi:hypothetical protein
MLDYSLQANCNFSSCPETSKPDMGGTSYFVGDDFLA